AHVAARPSSDAREVERILLRFLTTAPQRSSRCDKSSYFLFVLTVHPFDRSGLSIFLPAQSRKKSNSARPVDPSIPMCVWPLSFPLKIGSSTLSESAGPTLRVRLAFIASTAA